MKTIIIDGVEYDLTPKALFKKGDWIYHEISGNTFHIDKIENGLYVSDEGTTISLGRQNDWRLWTIQDAKDGDVLTDGKPFIFKSIDVNKHSYAYCGLSVDNAFIIESEGEYGEWTWIQDIKPAPKEQRELLFQKMKEAGYKWDAEKKELKKIEHKHICKLDNSYACVKFPFKAKVKSSGTIVTIHDGQLSPDGKEWIKYQSDKEDGYKIYEPDNLELVCEIEQKSLWSEEDEKVRKRVVGLLEGWLYTFKETCYAEDCKCGISWLNSLKPKSHWKPSVAQMNALQCFLEHGCAAPDREASFAEKHLEELYNDLIKLLKQ